MNSLADFVAARKIASCGIDVFDDEPANTSPLHELDSAILTPHISALTKEAQVRSGVQIADYVWAGLEGSLVPTALTSVASNTEMSRHIAPFIPAANMLGRFLSQIKGNVPSSLKVKMMGNLAELDPTALATSVLEGALSYKHAQCSNMQECAMFAERHGISIKCKKTDVADEYSAGIEVEADDVRIAATVFGADKLPRIISIFDYKIDVAPSKHSLLLEYADKPGNCGIIGTILGQHNINISTMQIATSKDEKNALVFVNVSSEVSEDILQEFREKIDLKSLYTINL